MHFYKQMVGNFMHSIALPEKLMPHIRELVGSVIKLKRPSGATWHVGIIKFSENLVMKPGWEDFVNENGVSPNDLLVFKYVGGIEFEVLLFDPWGCEKSGFEEIVRNSSVPLALGDRYNTSYKIQEMVYRKTTEINESETAAKKLSNQKSRKRKEVSADASNEQHFSIMSDKTVVCNSASLNFCNMHFLKQMSGLSMHKMTLPVKIGMNFEAFIDKVIQLKRPSGDTWHIGLIWTGEELVLESGWDQFVVANSISKDDFMVFKFIGGSQFEVLIFDPNGHEKSSNVGKKMRNGFVQVIAFEADPIRSKPDNYVKRSNEIKVYGKAMEDIQGCSTGKMSERNYFLGTEQLSFGVQGQNPSFLQIVKPSSLTIQCGISIPKKFSAEHLPKESQDLILYCPVKKKTWQVRYLYSQYQQFIRYAGWGKFVQENNLMVGDACSFELIKTAQPLTFVVQVSRA